MEVWWCGMCSVWCVVCVLWPVSVVHGVMKGMMRYAIEVVHGTWHELHAWSASIRGLGRPEVQAV